MDLEKEAKLRVDKRCLREGAEKEGKSLQLFNFAQ